MIGPGTAEVTIVVLESPVKLKGVPARVTYAVQLGAFASREAAETLQARARQDATDVVIVSGRSGSRELYRVRVGNFQDVDDAKAEAARLKRAGFSGVVVER
jgi:cell division protein FtsN